MKSCKCGGTYQRHGAVKSKVLEAGERYKCQACGKSITVRAGEISCQVGRPKIRDWRHA